MKFIRLFFLTQFLLCPSYVYSSEDKGKEEAQSAQDIIREFQLLYRVGPENVDLLLYFAIDRNRFDVVQAMLDTDTIHFANLFESWITNNQVLVVPNSDIRDIVSFLRDRNINPHIDTFTRSDSEDPSLLLLTFSNQKEVFQFLRELFETQKSHLSQDELKNLLAKCIQLCSNLEIQSNNLENQKVLHQILISISKCINDQNFVRLALKKFINYSDFSAALMTLEFLRSEYNIAPSSQKFMNEIVDRAQDQELVLTFLNEIGVRNFQVNGGFNNLNQTYRLVLPEDWIGRKFARQKRVFNHNRRICCEFLGYSFPSGIRYSFTALSAAVLYGNIEVVRALLRLGADPNFVITQPIDPYNLPSRFFETPMHIAALMGHEDIVRLFLSYGINPNTLNTLQMTPLHLAALSGQLNSLRRLLENSADPTRQDHDGSTPLILAIMNNFVEGAYEILNYNHSRQYLELRTNRSGFVDGYNILEFTENDSGSSFDYHRLLQEFQNQKNADTYFRLQNLLNDPNFSFLNSREEILNLLSQFSSTLAEADKNYEAVYQPIVGLPLNSSQVIERLRSLFTSFYPDESERLNKKLITELKIKSEFYTLKRQQELREEIDKELRDSCRNLSCFVFAVFLITYYSYF